ncbi:hypothetical protein XnspCFBP7698_19065 [Xanthomonas sp. CFBP 7698]|nr:hypothetical protein XnspCFBP7698_19065 [Xanthomonas sp. CFBP 7698]
MPEVRTAALEFASAKGHGRGRSPYRECRNAKQCKVCNCCSAPSASGHDRASGSARWRVAGRRDVGRCRREWPQLQPEQPVR